MYNLSINNEAGKVGLALNIEDKNLFIDGFVDEIYEHEKQFWVNKMKYNKLKNQNSKQKMQQQQKIQIYIKI